VSPPPIDDASSAWARGGPERLYVITGGRRASGRRADVELITLVVTRAAARPEMQPEHASILRMCQSPLSMAEISAYLKLPFSVVAILVSDLLADSSVELRAAVRTDGIPHAELLKTVMYGLEKL
jgi:hypothetical protein